MPIHAYYLSV